MCTVATLCVILSELEFTRIFILYLNFMELYTCMCMQRGLIDLLELTVKSVKFQNGVTVLRPSRRAVRLCLLQPLILLQSPLEI